MSEFIPLTTAVSYQRQPGPAAEELRRTLQGPELGFVLFFCSADYPLEALAKALNQAFDGLPMAGCTTAGEITPDGYSQGCITAIGFDRRGFAVEGTLIEQLDPFSLTDAQAQVEQLMRRCAERQIAPIKGNTFALTLLDGLSVQEELVLAALNAALGSIPHFGGSAADELQLIDTHVFFDGRFHTGAAVLLLFNTRCDFKVFSRHHMKPTDDKLVVTAADSDQRRVMELNAEPAAQAYAEAVGLPLAALDHKAFALNPIAVRLGDDYYVRSIQQVNEDLSLSFYCAVENGIVLTVVKPGDIVEELRRQLAQLEQEIGTPQLIIGCDCFLRRLEVEHKGLKAEISALLRDSRVIGFNTYGEQFAGMHINQTFTGVAIGSCPDE
ncbi:nitric oxide-sensing protein NosP [Marinobacterium arenosum]|uniref:nitric oxide-sensing protein NosP n=1 Tax=Marinobacterium arenosum TaxID=2862496 RepID=UPI001C9857D8|nr:nitric oxide-sensing protein NosP [Marinobacterium arenosum]MBY4675873.1 FIST C-terminal domain-containing protein [Marinobacterium arenosum]